ncbi:hypothetical protein INR49_017709 [Caranx melampygus]|nr:hypothetical protein INR49_017709 [Caranx melampygus]
MSGRRNRWKENEKEDSYVQFVLVPSQSALPKVTTTICSRDTSVPDPQKEHKPLTFATILALSNVNVNFLNTYGDVAKDQTLTCEAKTDGPDLIQYRIGLRYQHNSRICYQAAKCGGFPERSDVELINAADQFPVGTEWFNGAEGHCALCDGGV